MFKPKNALLENGNRKRSNGGYKTVYDNHMQTLTPLATKEN